MDKYISEALRNAFPMTLPRRVNNLINAWFDLWGTWVPWLRR